VSDFLIKCVEKVQEIVEKWRTWTQEAHLDNGEPVLTYVSPASKATAVLIQSTVLGMATALTLMPGLNPTLVHAVDELMRVAARL